MKKPIKINVKQLSDCGALATDENTGISVSSFEYTVYRKNIAKAIELLEKDVEIYYKKKSEDEKIREKFKKAPPYGVCQSCGATIRAKKRFCYACYRS